jgi:uncharacterized protein involved in exopolysaccharide biosynthesis
MNLKLNCYLNLKEICLAIERKQTVNQNLYVFLLEKMANTRIAKAGIIPQTKVIEKARPIGLVRPDKKKNNGVFCNCWFT